MEHAPSPILPSVPWLPAPSLPSAMEYRGMLYWGNPTCNQSNCMVIFPLSLATQWRVEYISAAHNNNVCINSVLLRAFFSVRILGVGLGEHKHPSRIPGQIHIAFVSVLDNYPIGTWVHTEPTFISESLVVIILTLLPFCFVVSLQHAPAVIFECFFLNMIFLGILLTMFCPLPNWIASQYHLNHLLWCIWLAQRW